MNDYVMPERPVPTSYIGMKKEKAIELSKLDGWIMHVEYDDGIYYPMSASLCYDRFIAGVSDGVITWTGVVG